MHKIHPASPPAMHDIARLLKSRYIGGATELRGIHVEIAFLHGASDRVPGEIAFPLLTVALNMFIPP